MENEGEYKESRAEGDYRNVASVADAFPAVRDRKDPGGSFASENEVEGIL